jgi:hypothetical protein
MAGMGCGSRKASPDNDVRRRSQLPVVYEAREIVRVEMKISTICNILVGSL